MSIRVQCYAGHRGEETPRRFTVGQRQIEVVDVLDLWLSPRHRYFKVRGSDGCVYILCHNPQTSHWTLPLFAPGKPPQDRLSG